MILAVERCLLFHTLDIQFFVRLFEYVYEYGVDQRNDRDDRKQGLVHKKQDAAAPRSSIR